MSSFPSPPTPSTAPRRVDIHCHCLPGVDDGPASVEDSLALCRLLLADGFTDVIATPHQLGRYDGLNISSQIRASVDRLQSMLKEKRIPLRLHAGGEVRVDENIPRLLQQDRILTLCDGGKYLLLELSFSAYIDPAGLLGYLGSTGLTVILAHAERYAALQRDHGAAGRWLEGGALLQLNADSLLGGAGAGAQSAAWDWLQHGWAALLATDAHGAGTRAPRMREAIEIITRRLGHDLAYRVCVENPLAVLEGKPIALR